MTFLMTMIGILLTTEVCEFVNCLIALLLAPRFGLEVRFITFWGNIFTKKDGEWVRTRGKFSLLVQYTTVIDISRPVSELSHKKFIPLDIILLAVQALIAVGVFFAWRAIPAAGGFIVVVEWRDVMFWMFVDCVMMTVLHIIMFIRVHFIRKTGLEGHYDYLLNCLRRGEEFPESYMRPVEELPFGNVKQVTKIKYYRLYNMYLLWTGQFDRLYLPMHETAVYLHNRSFVVGDTGYYYDVVFYYSRFEFDPSAARYFMDKIRSVLASDPDANAKRVLAYYAYGVENDKEKARYFINEALAAVDNFSLPGMERELERRLVTELDERLASEGVI